MAFKVELLPSAQNDLAQALKYYQNISIPLARKFYYQFEQLIAILSGNPFFKISYYNVRIRQIKGFPYIAHFIIKEEEVTIIAVVFGKRGKTNFAERLNEEND